MCICTLINLFLCRSSPHPKKLHISHTFKHHCFEQLHCLKLHWLKTCFMYNLWPLWWCLHHHWHCHSHPWLCHHYHICSGACVVVVVITAAVREALPAANTAPFPTEGATTAKPKALQPRAEAEVELRPQMPTVRGPD